MNKTYSKQHYEEFPTPPAVSAEDISVFLTAARTLYHAEIKKDEEEMDEIQRSKSRILRKDLYSEITKMENDLDNLIRKEQNAAV